MHRKGEVKDFARENLKAKSSAVTSADICLGKDLSRRGSFLDNGK